MMRGTFRLPFGWVSRKTIRWKTLSDKPEGWRALLQWAMTPPQSIAVYFIVLVLVLGASFYAGTLKPKKVTGMTPARHHRSARLTLRRHAA